MGPAVPAHFAAAFPDGFHQHEVRKPERKIRIGRAWYIYDPEDRPMFFASLAAGSDALMRLIDAAGAALDADMDRVFLVGFSQGAYLAHYTALHNLDRVAGWVSQAGGFRKEYGGDPFPDIGGRPVLIQHGKHDEAIGCDVAEATATLLADHGAEVELRFYDAGHVIRPEMATDVRAWLERLAPAPITPR
jgi:predicted esterase